MAFEVYRADGTIVRPGETLRDCEGELVFVECTQHQQIMVQEPGSYPKPFYPFSAGVEIRGVGQHAGLVCNPQTPEGHRLQAIADDEQAREIVV